MVDTNSMDKLTEYGMSNSFMKDIGDMIEEKGIINTLHFLETKLSEVEELMEMGFIFAIPLLSDIKNCISWTGNKIT